MMRKEFCKGKDLVPGMIIGTAITQHRITKVRIEGQKVFLNTIFEPFEGDGRDRSERSVSTSYRKLEYRTTEDVPIYTPPDPAAQKLGQKGGRVSADAKTPKQRRELAALGGARSPGAKNYWSMLTPEERSAEMSRRRKKGIKAVQAA